MSAARTFLQRRCVADARALLLDGISPVDAEDIAVDDAAGRIAASDIVASHPSPHYRASAMDGIAVRAADTVHAPCVLGVAAPDAATPPAGVCAPVDTGSMLPEWADAVVRVENTRSDDDGGYRVLTAVTAGQDVRRAGEDIDAGTVVVGAGAPLRPWDLAAVLATGTATVAVRRRPRVAILATGGEVVEPGGAAAAGQVIESNSRMLAALVEEWGASAHRLGLVADDEAALAAALADAADRFDAVAVIAGSSAGRRDFTVAALATAGSLLVHGLDVAPGRPAAIAHLRCGRNRAVVPALALPGYPVAALVVADVLLRPLVAALLGAAEPRRPSLRARVLRKIPSRLGLEEFRRVVLLRGDDGSRTAATLASGAGSISTVTGAHGWLRIDAAVEGIDAGSDVDVEMFVPVEEADAAFVIGGRPCAASATLEARLRRLDPRARVRHLGRGRVDALDAVERGEAHAAFVDHDVAAPLVRRGVPGDAAQATVAVVAGSPGDRRLAALEDAGRPQ